MYFNLATSWKISELEKIVTVKNLVRQEKFIKTTEELDEL